MDQRSARTSKRIVRGALATAFVALLLAACGGGDGDDGTATSAVESTAATIAESPTPAILTETSAPGGTPTAGSGVESASPGAATPTPAIVVSAPPIVIPTPGPSTATPVSAPPVATPVPVAGEATMGDGTGGPNSVMSVVGGTPVAGGTPVVTITTVASCTVEDLPPYTGSSPFQVTTIELNFRSGPGTDCDPIGEPLPAGVEVEIRSDPVQRDGDDITWVAVSLDGEEGWMATEFLEPAPQ